jgi:hypothetical protein
MRGINITKLDNYDYDISPGVIRIKLTSTNDPDLVDILSEINRSNGRIYVDGFRYLYSNNYRLFAKGSEAFIELDVVETA